MSIPPPADPSADASADASTDASADAPAPAPASAGRSGDARQHHHLRHSLDGMMPLDGMTCSINGTSLQIIEPPRALDATCYSPKAFPGSQSDVNIICKNRHLLEPAQWVLASTVLADGGYE